MDRHLLTELVEASDSDGLIRFIDGVCAAREWEGLLEVKERCLEAATRGKQLAGVAEFADYRTALEAPGPIAGTVVTEGAGRNTLGPLWEVAASTHTWDELEASTPDGPPRTLVAYERSLRGDAITAERLDPHLLDIPLAPATWEPIYQLAVYRSDTADFPEAEPPRFEVAELGSPGEEVYDHPVTEALYELVKTWCEESSGRYQAVAVDGDAAAAVRALGPTRAGWAPVSLEAALAALVWAGASGGAYGRRRGTPVGRANAWWLLATLTGLDEDWPADEMELAEAAAELGWFLWDPGDSSGGWRLHVAVEDSETGRAWALTAVDAV